MDRKYEKGEEVFFTGEIATPTVAGLLGISGNKTINKQTKVFCGKIESVNTLNEYIIRDNRKQADSLHRIKEKDIFPANQSDIRIVLNNKIRDNKILTEDNKALHERIDAINKQKRLNLIFNIMMTCVWTLLATLIIIWNVVTK